MPGEETNGKRDGFPSPAEAARAILAASPYQPLRHLECRFDDGELTIAGHVPSFYLKQIALFAVQQLDGVERISNIVEVSGASL